MKSGDIELKANEHVEYDMLDGTKVIIKDKPTLEKIRFEGLRIDSYLDNIKKFYDTQPFFYDRNQNFWFWNIERHCYEITDEIDILNAIDKNLSFYGQTIGKGIRNNYLEAIKRYGREKMPKDAPAKWVQFKYDAYSVTSECTYSVLPNYLFTNPIPWEISESDDTPTMDKFFSDWVGPQKQLLYEIIAYCCYRGYPIQSIFCLYGSGANGKSTFLAILRKFIGECNVTGTELDLLCGNNSSRFESSKLYKKLVCFMGETNFGILNKSSLLKKLTSGMDTIGYEMKNKMPFDDVNYAKIIIASNSLPSSSDTSDGFYRRWNIIKFNNQFPEGRDLLKEIPDIEYNNLARKCMNILPKLLKRGHFSTYETIEDKKKAYIMASNPITEFIKEHCEVKDTNFCSYSKIYMEYCKYLSKHKMRKVKMPEFKEALENEGFYVEKTSKRELDGSYKNGYFVMGLDFVTFVTTFQLFPTSFPAHEKEVEIQSQLSQLSQSFNQNLVVWQKCTIKECNEVECNYDGNGVPYCKKHWNSLGIGI